MNKSIPIFTALFLGSLSLNVLAATPEDIPPAQVQKNNVPDSTSNGNFLEPQPDENGATGNITNKDEPSKKSNTGKTQINKKPAIRGKQTTEQPADGGIAVEQK